MASLTVYDWLALFGIVAFAYAYGFVAGSNYQSRCELHRKIDRLTPRKNDESKTLV